MGYDVIDIQVKLYGIMYWLGCMGNVFLCICRWICMLISIIIISLLVNVVVVVLFINLGFITHFYSYYYFMYIIEAIMLFLLNSIVFSTFLIQFYEFNVAV